MFGNRANKTIDKEHKSAAIEEARTSHSFCKLFDQNLGTVSLLLVG